MNNATNTATKTCPCPRCDGKGKILAFQSTENGKCFLCAGAGRLDVRHSEIVKVAVRQASFECISLHEEIQDYGDATERSIERTAAALLAMNDTNKAREMLAFLAKNCGADVRKAVIEAGRRLKADAA